MNETIEQVEDQILLALAPLKVGQPGGYVSNIDTYQGQLDQGTVEEIIAQLGTNFPALLVVYLGSQLSEDPPYLFDDVQTWGIFICAQNLRGEKEARRGAYTLIQDVKTKLAGNSLGLGIKPLSLRAVDSVLVAPPLSIYGMTLETTLDYQADREVGP